MKHQISGPRGPYPALAVGLSVGQRLGLLEEEIRQAGWTSTTRSSSWLRYSWANPLTRTVVISKRPRSVAELAVLLAHELQHVRQFHGPTAMGNGFLARLWLLVLYLALPSRRLLWEMEAEGHEAAMLHRITGADVAPYCGPLIGWQLPYLAGGEEQFVQAEIAWYTFNLLGGLTA